MCQQTAARKAKTCDSLKNLKLKTYSLEKKSCGEQIQLGS